MTANRILQGLEEAAAGRLASVKRLLVNEGRHDLVADLEAKLREVANGVSGARSVWHSISPAQRRTLETLGTGRWLVRQPASRFVYDAHGQPHAEAGVCKLPTARNLIARGLLDCEGGVFDPEARLVLSDHARFVLKHGRLHSNGEG